MYFLCTRLFFGIPLLYNMAECSPCAPSHCAHGTNFSVDHALLHLKDEFPSVQHYEARDLTAELLSEVCHTVEIEPHLQLLVDETQDC